MSSTLNTSQLSTDITRPRLKPTTIVGYGMGDAGCNVAFQMTAIFLLFFYTNVVGIRPEHAGAILLFVKIWDAFADLFAGRVVDATMTRWGKFRPFLLWYSVPLLASVVLCFWIPVEGYGMKVAWATVTYALMGLLYSMVNIPYGSLAGAMSQNPVDRSRLASARMVGSGFTILLLALVLAPQLKSAENLGRVFLLTAALFLVIGVIFFAITFVTSQENVYREVEKVSLKETLSTVRRNGPLLRLCLSSLCYLTAQNVISAGAVYIANDILFRYDQAGNWLASTVTIITVGAVLYTGPFGPVVTRKLGKKRGFLIACTTAGLAGLAFIFFNTAVPSLWLSLASLFVLGVSMGMLNTMTWALEADTVEYGEYKTGIRTEGATYSAFSFTRKVGQALGVAVAGWGLGLAGYDGLREVQPPETLDSMVWAFGLLPTVIFVLAAVVMYGYPLTEEKFREIMKAIESNRVLRHEQYHGGEKAPQAPTRADRLGPTAADSHPTTTAVPKAQQPSETQRSEADGPEDSTR